MPPPPPRSPGSPRPPRSAWVFLLLALAAAVVFPVVAAADGADPPQVVFEGNSLTAGVAGMAPADTYPAQCARLLGPGWRTENAAVGGQSTFEMLRRAPAEIDARYRRPGPGHRDVLVVWEGSNDFAQNSATVDAAFTRLSDYARARRAAGWRVVIVTVLPRLAGPTFEHDRLALNARLREGWRAWADALADVAADPEIGAAESARDRRYYLDGTHLTAAGNARVAKVVRDAVAAGPEAVRAGPGTFPGLADRRFSALQPALFP